MQFKKQPVPQVTDDDVRRVAIRDFGQEKLSLVQSILGEYGTETWHREVARVRLAILKLAEGNLERLLNEILVAIQDYRDVIAPAEYPTYRRIEKDNAKLQKVYEDDWKQYNAWLNKT